MQSKDYWIMRALQREADSFQSTGDTIRRLRSIYDMSAARLVKVVKSILVNFMAKSGVSDGQEAKRLLSTTESAAVMASLREEYAQTGSLEALAKLNAPAYAYRISRVQAIRQAIDAEAEWLNEKELQAGAKQLAETYDSAYYQTMYDRAKEPEGIPTPQETAGANIKPPDFSPLSSRDVTEALQNRWNGENYSERVWKNTHLVASEAGKIIDAGLTSGATVAQMSYDIIDLFDVAYYAAARLVRTEINRMHNDATVKAYKAMGVEWYEYLATLDARTCSVCGALDGKHFKVDEAQTGVNLPPLHPNDRCTTVAWYPGEESGGMRTARDPQTGRNYKVPVGMTYEQWRKEIAEKHGDDALEKAQKCYANLKSDMVEQRKMSKILPKEVPPKIADFQDLKYNEPEKWKDLIYYYRNINGRPVEYVKIDRELEKLGIVNKGKAYPVDPIEIRGWRDHAEKRLAQRGLTKEQTAAFMDQAKVMMKRYPEPNTVHNYYCKDGVVGVKAIDGVVQTVYDSKEFKADTIKLLEVIDKYVPDRK